MIRDTGIDRPVHVVFRDKHKVPLADSVGDALDEVQPFALQQIVHFVGVMEMIDGHRIMARTADAADLQHSAPLPPDNHGQNMQSLRRNGMICLETNPILY